LAVGVEAVKRVIIESPFGKTPTGERVTNSEMSRNMRYLKRCIKDSLERGEAPFASHGFYPLVLNDAEPEQRTLGIHAGFAWLQAGELVAVYSDHGRTAGMAAGMRAAEELGIVVELRHIGKEPECTMVVA
jgi:hypothetical protein